MRICIVAQGAVLLRSYFVPRNVLDMKTCMTSITSAGRQIAEHYLQLFTRIRRNGYSTTIIIYEITLLKCEKPAKSSTN